jgi:hypothetical protein
MAEGFALFIQNLRSDVIFHQWMLP